ncbi:unnamed protein product [Rotaria socialis]|uniref:Beta-lactamase-related domain-containing protein n=1 Tax=Rotaria socialis TaxID=392032 RepID=A0A818EMD1_9BILA|nr:unnamed protein product [Rotaria socialis]
MATSTKIIVIVETVDFGTVDFGTVDFGTVDFGTVDFGTVDFETVDFGTVDFGTVDFGTVDLDFCPLMSTIAVALCVQRGLLDYSALVKTYWPEYGQNGKENTTVADILSHHAGLPLDNYPMERILNWTVMLHTLEQREPQWSSGTAHDYHPLAYGWLADELVR